MTRTEGKIKSFPKCKSPPNNAYADWDAIYDELKETYKPAIDAKNVGYDDRTKMFMVSIDPGFNEWALIAYNQNRLALSLSSCTLELYGGSIAGIRPPLLVRYPTGEDRPSQDAPAPGGCGCPFAGNRPSQHGQLGGYPHGAGYPQQSGNVFGSSLQEQLQSISDQLGRLTNPCPPPGCG